MKTFWALYKKELRFLLWPGIGIVLFANAGWLVLFLKFLPSTSLYSFFNFFFRPASFGAYSNFTIALPLVFLYSLVYEHISGKRHQGLLFPIRRSLPILAKFSAVMTWAYAAIPVTCALYAIHKLLGYPHPLFSSYSLGGFTYLACNILISGFASCTLVMLGYAVAISVRRLYVLVGTSTVIISFLVFHTLQSIVYLYTRSFISFDYFSRTAYVFSNLGSLILVAIVFLIPALFLYERYAEL